MTLLDLAERCEQASEPDRKLDAEIVVTLDLRPDWCRGYGELFWIDEDWSDQPIIRANSTHGERSLGHPPIGDYPRFTASLDAAMTLVPGGWAVSLTRTAEGRLGLANLYLFATHSNEPSERAMGKGETPALALCAAALKARAAVGSEARETPTPKSGSSSNHSIEIEG